MLRSGNTVCGASIPTPRLEMRATHDRVVMRG